MDLLTYLAKVFGGRDIIPCTQHNQKSYYSHYCDLEIKTSDRLTYFSLGRVFFLLLNRSGFSLIRASPAEDGISHAVFTVLFAAITR